MTKTIRYDKDLLNTILTRDEATLVGDCEKINRDVKPPFTCRCGKEENARSFRDILKKGAYCRECIYDKGSIKRNTTVKDKYDVDCISQIPSVKEKRIATNLARRGVKCPLQSKEVKDKINATNLERLGVEHPLQSEIVKDKIKATNLERLGVEHTFQSEEIKEKIKSTNLERLGVEYPGQSEEIKDKIKATNLERLGVEYAFQSEEVKRKTKITNLERLGVEHPLQSEIVKDKIKATNLERLGVEHPLQSEIVKDKIKATNLERYGVEHPLQSNKIMEKAQKNAKKYKEYKMPSGDIRKVQGFEHFALDILLKTYTGDQIKTERKDVPRIEYIVDGKKKYYFPDIAIPHENKIIEVKSTWTYKCKIDNIKQKAEATKAKGFTYEIWIYDAKGKRVNMEDLKCDDISKLPEENVISHV